jgi:hypothetical protein
MCRAGGGQRHPVERDRRRDENQQDEPCVAPKTLARTRPIE